MEPMSKALCLAAKAAAGSAATPTGPPGGPISPPIMALLALGTCMLAGWIALRVLRPRKVLLRNVPGRPNTLNPLHVLCVFLTFHVAISAAARSVGAAIGKDVRFLDDLPMPLSLWVSALGQVILAAGAVAVASMTFRHGIGRGMGLSGRHAFCDAIRGVLAVLAILPACMGALYLTGLLVRAGILPVRIVVHPILLFLPTAGAGAAVLAIVSTVVLAPLSEELFYRGLIQSMLRRYTRRPWAAILITSGIFAAVHWPLVQDMPALFVLSVALGYNYARTGRLVAPIVIHALFNAAMIWGTLSR